MSAIVVPANIALRADRVIEDDHAFGADLVFDEFG